VIADDFTFANVRIAAAAIANYVLAHEAADKGICIGYDTRFVLLPLPVPSRRWPLRRNPGAPAAAVTPTPAFLRRTRIAAAGGVMITSSHNPYQ